MRPLITSPTIYDPRLGQARAFEVTPGVVLSTLPERLWTMEAPSGYFDHYEPLLAETFSAVEGCPFVVYLAWGPDRVGQRRAFSDKFENSAVIADGALLLGRPRDLNDQILPHVWQLRQSLGGAASGLWSLGVAKSLDDVKKSIVAAGPSADSPIFGMAASMHAINCALCLDDGLEVFFLRLTPRAEQFADRLTASARDRTS